MPFSFADYANYKQSVRGLCANMSTAQMPDAILAAGYIFVDEIEARVNTLQPDYDSLTDKLPVRLAAVKLLAAFMCRNYCKGRFKTATDDQHSMTHDKIDWDAIAAQLEGAALPVLDPDWAPTTSQGCILVGGYNPATGEWVPSVGSDSNGAIAI